MDSMNYLSSEDEDAEEEEDEGEEEEGDDEDEDDEDGENEEDDEDEEDEEEETEESSCDSDEDSSSQQTLSNFGTNLANNDKLEHVCLGATRLALPQGLCENEAIFNEFFSLDTWQNVLTGQQREQLKRFLPSFPENDEEEKAETVQSLFARKNFKFGNPLNNLFSQLHSGYLRPDIAKMRTLMKKAQYREYRYRQRRYCYHTMRSLLVSRKRLLAAASSQPPDTPPRVERLIPPPRTSPVEQRARRRYFEELMLIRKGEGESSQSSGDDNYPEGPPPRLSKKQKKQLSTMELSLSPDLAPIPSTLNTSNATPFQLESRVTCTYNPYEITEESYKAMLMKHKKRRSHGEDHPELNVMSINLQEVAQRSQISRRTPSRQPATPSTSQSESASQPRSKKKIKMELANTPPPTISFMSSDRHNSPSIYSEDSCSIGFAEGNETSSDFGDKPVAKGNGVVRRKSIGSQSVPVLHIKEEVIEEEEPMEEEYHEEEEVAVAEVRHQQPSIPVPPLVSTSITPAVAAPIPITTQVSTPTFTFQSTQLKSMDIMSLPVKIEEAPVPPVNIPAKPELELTQETYVCFLSLVRDVICSTPDQRMGLAALEQKLRVWQESPISPLNDWYSLAPSWVSLIPSAVNFLSGDFPAETQPEDFVPYLEYKPHMEAYQWIGAGRDSDHHLAPLCTHWLERRNEVPSVPVRAEEQSEEPGLSTPPPPRCPTAWQARSAVGPERDAFHQQEKRRYENPNRAFTYRMHGFESVVSPVKGAYTSGSGMTKPRGHTLLVPDRPNYITILSLVRDAVARLPNGEGTRTDICELLRDSQYLSTGAEENYLQSVVGGALDRLHYEADTCVKYDPKRKMWIYLHRNRTEEEFEKLHQQQSTQPKSKRPSVPRKTNRSRARDKEVKPMQMVTTALATVLAPGRVSEQNSHAPSTPTPPKPVAPVKASPVATTVPRTFTLSSGSLQVATSSGIQTIQVSTTPSIVSGASLLATSASQGVKLTTAAAKKAAAAAANIASLTSTAVLNQQALAARLIVSSSGTLTMNKTVSTVAQAPTQTLPQVKQSSAGTSSLMLQPQTTTASTPTPPSSTAPLVLHPISQPRTTPGGGKTLLASVNAAQLVNVSQMQLVNAARALQQQQIQLQQEQLRQKQQQQQQQIQQQPQQQIQQVQQQVQQHVQVQQQIQQQVVIKQQQIQQLQQQQIQQQPKQVQKQVQRQQAQKKRQLQQQIQLQIQQQKSMQQKQLQLQQQKQQQLFEHKIQQLQLDQKQPQQISLQTTKTVASTMAAGVKLLNAQAAVKSLAGGSASPLHGTQAIFIKHSAGGSVAMPVSTSTASSMNVTVADTITTSAPTLLLGKSGALQLATSSGSATLVGTNKAATNLGGLLTAATSTSTTLVTSRSHGTLVTTAGGKPMVAKVLTNAQGQLISMESLLAHQKQQLAAAGTVRMSGTKPAQQASLIQLPGTGGVPQFAMVTQGGIVGPRLLQAAAQQFSQQQAQQTVQQGKTLTTAGLRMVTPAGANASATGLNVATIGGQPVILASKAQGAMGGQNVFLASGAGGGSAVVLTSPSGLRTQQGGTLVLQPGSAQQIVLPHGFQGGTLNFKTLQSLQGIRVIPLAQASAAVTAANTSMPKGRQQVYARIITPPNRVAAQAAPSSNITDAGAPNTEGAE